MLRQAAVVVACAAACSRDPGTPHKRNPPDAKKSAPLRGGGVPRSPRIASYQIEAKLDAVRHQVVGTETLTWKNTGGSTVSDIQLHMYLNAFKNEGTVFMRSSGGAMRGAKASDGHWGWIQLDAASQIADKTALPMVALPVGPAGDETVVQMQLPAPIGPGETGTFTFSFTDQLPEVFARTGYSGDFHMVGQWFPKIGVRVGPPGAERWECQPLHINTEFFADFGTYDVALTVPNTEVVAATGVLTGVADAPNNTRTFTYRAEDVHDFAWMADPFMEVMTDKATLDDGSVEVQVYYRPEQKDFATRHLKAAIGAIEKFSAWFYPYPWPTISIVDPPVEAADGAGGMEYPTLVTTAGDTVFARKGLHLPEYVTIHEVGHNWFQGLLASDEANEAWMDEGVNEWADGNVMAELYGARTSGADWMGWQAEIMSLRRALAADPASLPSPIATAAYAFVDNNAYAEATYNSTARALATLENVVGPARFAAAMKSYAKAFAFKHPTGADMAKALGDALGQDLGWFFGPVFHDVGGLAVSIRSANCAPVHPARGVFGSSTVKKTVTETEAPDAGGYRCRVVVQNTGTIHVPVDIELRFADGTAQRERWDDRGIGAWHDFTVERSTLLTEVWIDPDNKIALDEPIRHHIRLEGDGSASLRAAAWFGSLTQTLMQLVGP